MLGDAADASDFSLVSLAEILVPLLDARAPASVLEVGADSGDFTRELLTWGARTGTAITAIDPDPAQELDELDRCEPALTLVREPSLEALGLLPPAEAVIIDGDHNYFTVSEELRLIAEAAEGSTLPLLLIHDVGWPHARRDTYYAPERIPEPERQPLAADARLAPDQPGTASAGVRFPFAAEREGGPRNGVLTAIEDFAEQRPGLRLAIVPAFFGLGVLWPEQADWSDAVAAVIAPWDRSPMLERLERLRVAQIVDRDRLERQQAELRGMLGSRVFRIAERISRLRRGGDAALSRESVRRALGD